MDRTQVLDRVSSCFNFTVDKFRLSGPDGMQTPFFGLFRSDTCQVVGDSSVSARYTPHQTEDILALVEASAHAFEGEIDCRCNFRNGHYVSVMPSKEYRQSIAGTDTVWPRVIIRAAYDGQAFRASMGYFRDLCKNLAILREVSGTSVTIRHTHSLRSKMDDLIASFNTLRTSWTTLHDVIRNLDNRTVQMADFLNAIYPQPETDSQRSRTIHQNRTEAIFRRLQRESQQMGREIPSSFEVSAWLAFNAVQGYVQHEQSRHGSPTDFDRMILAGQDTAVRQAEQLAMATLSV